jgi:predicted aspartyl protease
MVFRIIISAVLAIFILSTAMAAGETIYTWTDTNGVRHMTNIPPVQSNGKVDIIEIEPPQITGEPEIQYAQPDEQLPSQDETEIHIINNHVIVPATISYKQKKIRANLLLDTGSTNITLHRDIAKKLSIKNPRKGSIRVAGGELIDAEAIILDSVTVGPHKEQNLVAGIIEHTGPDVAFDGLLGMNFLKKHQYTIDFENQVLLWNQ